MSTRPARLRPLVGPDFRLLSGDDFTALGFVAQGGDGCISVTSNAAPVLCRNAFPIFASGRMCESAAGCPSARAADGGAVSRAKSGSRQICVELLRSHVAASAIAVDGARTAGQDRSGRRSGAIMRRVLRVDDRQDRRSNTYASNRHGQLTATFSLSFPGSGTSVRAGRSENSTQHITGRNSVPGVPPRCRLCHKLLAISWSSGSMLGA